MFLIQIATDCSAGKGQPTRRIRDHPLSAARRSPPDAQGKSSPIRYEAGLDYLRVELWNHHKIVSHERLGTYVSACALTGALLR